MVQSFAREDQRSVIPAAIEFSDRSAAVVSRIAVGENSTRRKKNSRFAGRRAGDRRVAATAVSRRTVVSSREPEQRRQRSAGGGGGCHREQDGRARWSGAVVE
ncbi:ATP-binding cassette A2 [Striga asiatica]|uniref:ATP-binding cassette A2 n=1 Tax=Striga asiatica TaxID=4170 RepID=A0A5A7QCE1_STRAF|nr:ATP-binding cassette A2 [Striga asiatica]